MKPVLKEALNLLKKLEWGHGNECPVCGYGTYGFSIHAKDCEMGRVIKRLEGEVKRKKDDPR